jgi:hypothetical protein
LDYNNVAFSADEETLFTPDGQCLGADDGVGVWLMLEMIKSGVPGAYLFHRGEELSGIGSSAIHDQASEFLSQFKWAIAFDRRGTTDIITHQSGIRGCSDEFARELAKQLNRGGLYLTLSKNGSYTDTFEYFDIIPECTNVSVGYQREHTPNETLNLDYLFRLRNSICNYFDSECLPVERVPQPRIYGMFDSAPPDENWVFNSDFSTLVNWVQVEAPQTVAELIFDLSCKCIEVQEASPNDAPI